MDWMQEPGFENFWPCSRYVMTQFRSAQEKIKFCQQELDMVSIDACQPQTYQNGHQVLITNNWISPDSLDPNLYEKFADSWYGIYSGYVPIEDTACTHKFNCFINRMDPIRQSWLYQLIRRGMFDQGLISFNMDISRHKHLCPPNNTPHTVFENYFQQYLQIFGPEHEFIQSKVPYCNFNTETPLRDLIMQSKFSIVLETYFESNEVITFSEKIFRCLKLPRPWVLFAMKHAVKHLRDLGFDVLDDIVDHSYDHINFDIDRQVAILDQSEKLCNLVYNEKLVQRMKLAAIHNQQLLQSYLDRFNQDIDISFERVVKKCLKE
jgi:hypothetical protein